MIIPALMEAGGIFKLRESCKLQPGVPLKPMLARPTKSITEVLDRFEGKAFTCEYKYDGERAQIHFVSHEAKKTDTLVDVTSTMPAAGVTEKGISNIFSRNSEDLSKKYPDILAKLPDWVGDGVRSFVLDCETVAWDMVEKKVLPFQQLMTRKRKDVKTEDIKVKVCVFAFDLLYLNGEVSNQFERNNLILTSSGACEQVTTGATRRHVQGLQSRRRRICIRAIRQLQRARRDPDHARRVDQGVVRRADGQDVGRRRITLRAIASITELAQGQKRLSGRSR